MNKLLVGVTAIVVGVMCATATAECGRVWEDLSWWGKTGATPAVYKDAEPSGCSDTARSGCWWWPTTPATVGAGAKSSGPCGPRGGNDDKDLWGNRGVVYSMCPVTEEEPPPPPPPPADKVLRETPIFNDVLFDFDKSVLRPEAKAVIDQVVADLKQFADDTIEVQGHTCDLGSDAYNMGLGQRRADAIMKYMIETGVDAGRITAQSYGETTPAVPNDSAANRKLNRRGVFKVTVKTLVDKQ